MKRREKKEGVSEGNVVRGLLVIAGKPLQGINVVNCVVWFGPSLVD